MLFINALLPLYYIEQWLLFQSFGTIGVHRKALSNLVLVLNSLYQA